MLLASLYLPRGARFEPRPDGFAFVFESSSTRIEVRERLAPLRRARAIFDAALGVTTSAPIREYLTREGEHAAMLEVATASRRATLGIAYADHFYRLVVGHTDDAALADDIATCVRRLSLELSLGLAPDRRRRFRFTSPPGWSSLSRHGLITELFSPRFPSDPAQITVFPTSPIRSEMPSRTFDRSLYEMQWGGFSPSTTSGPVAIAHPALRAQGWQLEGTWTDGGRSLMDLVVLDDTTNVYVARLQHDGTRTDEHRATLHALVASIQPLARPRAGHVAA
jgi:hypothetical protein